jgi:uncharacterized repeat protein (TIGR01451 family)
VNDLGTYNGGSTYGSGINNSGQVVGEGQVALLWSNDVVINLGTLGGPFSEAAAVNDLGQVAGDSAENSDGSGEYAFIYTNGFMTKIGTTGPFLESYGYGINHAGQVVGQLYETADPRSQAITANSSPFLWPGPDGNPIDLGTFGAPVGGAYGINKSGQITGYAGVTPYENHAFLYSNGILQDLGTLGGSVSGGLAINDSGQITGLSWITGGSYTNYHAFLYSGGLMVDLAPDDFLSSGVSINNSGEVVGIYYATDSSSQSAFLYSPTVSSTIIPLPAAYANGVNDAGQVTGTLELYQAFHAYIATPLFRQVDPAPQVPTTFGRADVGKDSTVLFGCALTSASNMCRQLIALQAKTVPITIMTPSLLDSLLASNNGYDSDNDLMFGNLQTAIGRFANTQFTGSTPITLATYDSQITQFLYTLGERVILKFQHTTTDQTTGTTATGAHFVWVIGKENGDWKIADPGWNSVPSDIIESLQAHLNGFTTISASTGHTISHQFVLDSLRTFQNLDYVLPYEGSSSHHTTRKRGSDSDSSAAISISATGPVDLLFTDPQGRRLGHDQLTDQDYSEIPGGSYFTDTPILSPDGDAISPGDPAGIKQLFVPSPIVGAYTLQATGTATGSSTLTLGIIGPGGAEQTSTIPITTQAGVTTTEPLTYSSPNSADLSISQTSTPNPPKIGKNLTFNVTIKNNGPSATTVATVTDLLPDNTSFVSAKSTSGTCMQSGNVVSCALKPLAVSSSAIVTIVVRPSAAGTIVNSAYVAAFESDPDSSNNSSNLTVTVPNPLTLNSVVSRKTHGAAGTFDIALPLSGATGVECRSEGSGNDHSIVFTFDNNIVSGTASITKGVATIADTMFSGNTMTVDLSGVVNSQTLTMSLSGATDQFSQILPKTSLKATFALGDVNADKKVTSKDVSQAKKQEGPVTESNFRDDVTVDGTVDDNDVSLIQSQTKH